MVKHAESNSDRFFKLLNAIEPEISQYGHSSNAVLSPTPKKKGKVGGKDDDNVRCDTLNEEDLTKMIINDPTVCSERYPIDVVGLERIYPLHACCAIKPSLPFIKKIYKAYPDALLVHHGDDSSSSLMGNPLHYCFYHNASQCTIELVHYLVSKFPDCMKECNIKEERTPLHAACYNSNELLHDSNTRPSNLDIIPYLTEKYPDACRIQDIDGCTPLHLACDMTDAQITVVEDLTEVCPDACVIQSEDLSTPLHLAVQNKVRNIDVIKDLLRTNKMACQMKDDQERYPFTIAVDHLIDCAKSSSLSQSSSALLQKEDTGVPVLEHMFRIIECLVPKYSDVLEILYKDGLTPHQYAKDNCSSLLPDHMIEYLNPYEE